MGARNYLKRILSKFRTIAKWRWRGASNINKRIPYILTVISLIRNFTNYANVMSHTMEVCFTRTLLHDEARQMAETIFLTIEWVREEEQFSEVDDLDSLTRGIWCLSFPCLPHPTAHRWTLGSQNSQNQGDYE